MAKKKTVNTNKSSIITYEGNVSLKLVRNGNIIKKSTIKNNGVNELFYGIAEWLTSEGSQIRKPNYLGIGNGEGGTTVDLNSLINEYSGKRVGLTGKYFTINEDNNGYIANFTATITYASIGGSPIKEIGLFGTISTDSLLARITTPGDGSGIILPIGTDLIIDWSILVKNQFNGGTI